MGAIIIVSMLSKLMHAFCPRVPRTVHVYAWDSSSSFVRCVYSFARFAFRHCLRRYSMYSCTRFIALRQIIHTPVPSMRQCSRTFCGPCSYLLVFAFHVHVFLLCIYLSRHDQHDLHNSALCSPCHYCHHRVSSSLFLESTVINRSTVQFALSIALVFLAELKFFGSRDISRKSLHLCFVGT